jgi:DNA-directed RNA polymerase beta' subunit
MSIATKVTVAEIVNDLNRSELEKCIRIGMIGLGGAHYVTFTDGSKANLRSDGNVEVAERIIKQLHNGCIVHHTLKTGDHLLFNRQPTLSKASMMGFDATQNKTGPQRELNSRQVTNKSGGGSTVTQSSNTLQSDECWFWRRFP